MKRHILFAYACISCAISTAQNYLVEVAPLAPTSSIEFYDEEEACFVNHTSTIQYYDGFGKLQSTVAKEITPMGNNLVTNIERIGDMERTWLPVSTDHRQASPSDVQSQYHNDSYPYAETLYEYPSSDRPVSVQSPGSSWQGHAATYEYSGCPGNTVMNFSVSNNGNLVCQGYYAAGMLKMTTSSDEDGKEKVTYTNKLGQVILSKEGSASTYYVYDK